MQLKALLTSFIASTVLSYVPLANAADVIKHHHHHNKKPIMVKQATVIAAMPEAPALRWVGPYLGFETGTVINKFQIFDNVQTVATSFIKPKEQPLVGLFAGYNIAAGRHAIFGIDGNINYHAINSASDLPTYTKLKDI